MAGFTTAFARTTLDAAIIDGDVIRYSENGSSASAHVAATEIAGWTASTDADPTVRSNTAEVESAACDADDVTFTHWSIWDSASSVQKTDWTVFASGDKVLDTGGTIIWAAAGIDVTMT
jgi:hypothetical protein